ncbi:Cytochrome P450 [Aspergillus sp. HF37]|nr:Cytochrome P450 [Aspergillus sp. HF37]
MSSLVQMEPCVVECTGVLVDRLTEFASSGKPFNLQHWMQYYAFDIIGLITVDKRFGFLDSGCDQNDFLASLHAYLAYAAHVGIYAELHSILSKVLALLPGPGIAHLASFAAQQISETKKRVTESASASEKSNESTDSFLQKLLKMSIQDPEKITQADIFTTCITNIGAGSDTTSISLTALLYNLLKHPETYQKLRDEISRAKSEGKLSFPVTFQESQRLPFLQACIKEALRIHPATGLPLVRVVPKGGITLCGKYFPEGEIVGVNAWVLHRNKSVFGDDADDYRPERWMESSEKTSEMDRNFFAFGAGARTCIGKNISLMEIGKLIPELITRFDFELTEPQAELETQNVWFVKQRNVMCRVKLMQ